jgi:glycosyltransferase involved in cell wall biosynthesis
MTRRKVVLHIGTMKTGTSSIQATLAQSPQWLAKRGYAFYAGSQRTSDRIARRLDTIRDDRNLILSDEGLWHFANSDRSDTAEIARVLRDCDVTVLAYFRRPDEFLESWFTQGLKNGKGQASFEKFLDEPFTRAGCDFQGRLKIFTDLFGKDAIRIAPYENAQLAQGDVVTDFLVRTGLASPEDTHKTLMQSGLKYPPKQNISPEANVILLVSLLRRLGRLPEDALKQVLKAVPLFADTPEDAALAEGRILLPQEMESVNARYLPVFRKMQAEFSGGASADFFVDWSTNGVDVQTSVVRELYDQLINPSTYISAVNNAHTNTTHQKRINVVFAIQKLAGLTGGAERVFVETAEAMAGLGMDVRIVTFDPSVASSTFGSGVIPMRSLFPNSEGARKTSGAAVRLLKALPNIPGLTHLKWRGSHGMFIRALRADLLARPADVVVAFLPPAITAAAYAVAGLPTRVVASTHNVPEQDFGDGPRWDRNPLYRTRARAALARAARVTVLLPEFREWFPQAVQSHVVHMPNPVTRVSTPVPGTVREKIILGVGRLTAIKRWDLLIAAFAQVADELPGWQVRIFGEGSEQAALQAQIVALGMTGRIHLMGTTQAIGAEYDRSSLLVHPSEFEGFGLSVAEAMAHGLPVVAFADCAGVNMLIQTGENGVLLPRGQTALMEGLVALAKDEDLRLRLGQAAAQITTRFDAQKIYADWARLLRQVAAK